MQALPGRQCAQCRDFWLRPVKGTFINGRFNRIDKVGREDWLPATHNPILDLNG